MDKASISIDEYVESLYSGLNDDGDAADLKEQMRDHLQDAAQRLRDEGYSEEDSVRLAIERFGDQASVKSDLSSLYRSSSFPPQTDGEAYTTPPVRQGDDPGVRKGISALVLAILSLFIPVVGLVLAVIGMVIAIRNLRRPGPTVISPVVSGIAVALAIVGIFLQLLAIVGISNFAVAYDSVRTTHFSSGNSTSVTVSQPSVP